MSEENAITANEVLAAQFGEQQEQEQEPQIEEVEKKEEEQNGDEVFNKKFAALSRKEKDLKRREAEFQDRMSQLETMKQELESMKQQPVKEEIKEEIKEELPLEYRLRKDPIATLQEMGLDYDKLTELMLNDGKPTTDMQMQLIREELERDYQKKFTELENRLNDKEKSEEEQKYKQVVEGFRSEISNFVKADQDNYELINANDADDLVYDVIEEHYNETGRVLEIADAAKAVEDYLEEEAKRLLSLKKLSRTKELPEDKKEPENKNSPTLTNDLSASSSYESDIKLSDEESLYNAAKLIKWD